VKLHKNCRACGSTSLIEYLNLGELPLANNLGKTKEESKEFEKYPLAVMFCDDCGLSQLSVVIDPKVMFSYYPYRSAVNMGYVNHCTEMAKSLQHKYGFDDKIFHIDIAGNDGTLLKQFKKVLNHRVLNVDPAENLVEISRKDGIAAVPSFWNSQLSGYLKGSMGSTDLITATNVFAHVDDIKDFIRACRINLKTDGILVIECPYIVDFIERFEFDTVYMEHCSYINIISVSRLCSIMDMKIISVEKQDIHGGTVRITITNEESSRPIEESVHTFINKEIELGYNEVDKYIQWGIDVKKIIDKFSKRINELKDSGKSISAFAASAKGNTLLNSAHINDNHIYYVVDQTPEKLGHYYSGTGIEIVDIKTIEEKPTDYILILSWNFKKEIIEKLKPIYNGEFITYLDC
jgi:SAM-dependent methyltransferase